MTTKPGVWGDIGITWDNASPSVKEQFALARLFWYYQMIQSGGPDGSELDALVAEEAAEAAAWYGPILDTAARSAGT